MGRQESVLGSADDVAQEVCVAVVSALGSYQPAGLSFRAFVYGIAGSSSVTSVQAVPPAPQPSTATSRCSSTAQSADTGSASTIAGPAECFRWLTALDIGSR